MTWLEQVADCPARRFVNAAGMLIAIEQILPLLDDVTLDAWQAEYHDDGCLLSDKEIDSV